MQGFPVALKVKENSQKKGCFGKRKGSHPMLVYTDVIMKSLRLPNKCRTNNIAETKKKFSAANDERADLHRDVLHPPSGFYSFFYANFLVQKYRPLTDRKSG